MAESTNRQKLRVLTSRITKDLLKFVRGETLGAFELDVDDWDGLIPADRFVRGALLGPYSWDLTIDPAGGFIPDADVEELVVSIALEDVPGAEINVKGGDQAAGTGEEGIDVIVQMGGPLPRRDMGFLQREIMNSVAHELEHKTQKSIFKTPGRGESYYSGLTDASEGSSAFQYLMRPDEIAAHVIGYAAGSRSTRELEDEIKDFLSGWQSKGHLSKAEVDQVFDTWTEWARRNLKQKRFRA